MHELLIKLENISCKLEQVISLTNCMCDQYFDTDIPDKDKLVLGYTDYTNMFNLIQNIIYTQCYDLKIISKNFYEIYWELKNIK